MEAPLRAFASSALKLLQLTRQGVCVWLRALFCRLVADKAYLLRPDGTFYTALNPVFPIAVNGSSVAVIRFVPERPIEPGLYLFTVSAGGYTSSAEVTVADRIPKGIVVRGRVKELNGTVVDKGYYTVN
jgi:hypothetical protein